MSIDHISLQGKRATQEDRVIIDPDFIIIVLDGHGSYPNEKELETRYKDKNPERVVDIVYDLFPKKLKKNIECLSDDSPEQIITAIKKTCMDVDRTIFENYHIQNKCIGGTTLSGVVKVKGKEYIVNVGDSETVFVNGIVPVYVTQRHKPDIEHEYRRIFSNGGFVFSKRSYGTLSISRVFGDFDLGKGRFGKYNENAVLCPVADVILVEKDYTNIFIYSDGFGDFCDYQKLITAAFFNKEEVPENEKERTISERLGHMALEVSNDNITVIHMLK